MAADKLKFASGNSASTTSSSSISNSDTSLPLTSDTAFAAESGEGMVIIDEGTNNEELAYATGKSGSSLTIPLANRGLEGGSAKAHDSGVSVKGILSAGMWNDLINSLADNVLDKATGTLKLQGTATVTDILDEDNMASDSATALATQQSIKAYVDGKIIDEDDMASDSATKVPTQQSVKAYVDSVPSGKVLQVVSASYSTVNNTTNTTLTDTGLSATITPSSTSSKILVFVKTGEMKTADANTGIYVALVRGSTEIAQVCKYACFPTANLRQYASVNYLDSPATTSATTYKTQYKRQVGSGTVTHCEDGTTSYITLMEIGA